MKLNNVSLVLERLKFWN